MVDGGPGRVAGSWGPNLLLTVLGSSAVAVGAFIYLYGFPGESRDGERAESPGRTRSGSSSSASSWSSFSSTTSFSFLTASCPSMFWSNARLRARDVVGRAVAAVNSAGRWCCSSALSASEGTSSSRWRDRLAAAYYEYDDAQNPAHRLASADSCPRDVVRRDEFTRACDAFRRAQLKGHMTIEEQLNLYGMAKMTLLPISAGRQKHRFKRKIPPNLLCSEASLPLRGRHSRELRTTLPLEDTTYIKPTACRQRATWRTCPV
eukprot:GHVT01080557.1.p1 GENE.GHVT01080557.1~~GHVT01080557.1.p1  ORF type:complete len:262 (+),score=36.48 GHVT01080557.1:631-1416(+)